MNRRFAFIVVALAAVTSLLLAACNAAPAAPALTDPKDILVQSLASLKDVKTVELTGSLTGTLEAAELGGNLDLSTTKLSAAIDIPNKKAKFNLDAPSIMGTKIDALVLDGAAYLKVDGMLATMLGGTPGKYTKTDVPEESGKPVTDPAEIAKAIDEMKTALDKLPTPPTKGADEKCGDQDCYHVTLTLSAEDLKKLSTDAPTTDGAVTFDLFSRKNDLRPAKLVFSITSAEMGTIGLTIELKYDTSVNVEAPAAGDIAP